MMQVDAVVEWLRNAPEALIDELYSWAESAEDDEGAGTKATSAEFTGWWARLSAAAGGAMPHSMQTDVKAMFGEVAWLADQDGTLDNVDALGVVGVQCREDLIAVGLAPDGPWRADLLADKLERAMSIAERSSALDSSWSQDELQQSLHELLDSCDDLLGSTRSTRTRRAVEAVAAVCALRVLGPDEALVRVQRFFDLDRQAERESGAESSWSELTYVALAGVTAHAVLGNRAGIQEIMRLIRQRAEPAGGSLPTVFMRIWARGLRDLDPALAQMIARQLLLDLYEDAGERTDAAFGAAFLLLESSLAVGDQELADELVNEWMPLALEAPHGQGSQAWVNSFEATVDDDEA